jgi:predicted RNA-binding Zn-ribbon protein involved in translation (DUF1610 family)
MLKFTFIKKTASDQPFFRSLDDISMRQNIEAESNKKRVDSAEAEAARKNLDAPFAVFEGDPEASTSKDPNAKPGQWNFIHHTKVGRTIARGIKKKLDRPGSGYTKEFIPKDQYAHDEEMSKHAPMGMWGYKPAVRATGSHSRQARELQQLVETGRVEKRLREHNGGIPETKSSDPLSPTDPLNLVRNFGFATAIKRILTDKVPFRPAKPGEDLCGCGRPISDHVSKAAAKEHYAKTGEHLEIHDYSPQNVGDQTGTESRITQSPLYGGNLETQDGIPTVLVGTGPHRFNKITTAAPSSEDRKPNIAVVGLDNPPCPGCVGGKLDPSKRENKFPCPDCSHGSLNFKIVKDEAGNEKAVLHTVGIGNGKQKYVNEADVPKGKSIDTEFPCENCGSNDSTVTTTPDNVHEECGGTGISIKSRIKLPKIKLMSWAKPFSGNPILYRRFSKGTNSDVPGIDGWLAHGDKECTRCHGDDNYQTADKLPCNCRIGSFANKDQVVAPAGAKYIHPDHVEIPRHVYMSAMKELYPDEDTNPHKEINLQNTADPITGASPNNPTGHRYEGPAGVKSEAHLFRSVVTGGVSIPHEDLEELNKQSAANWSGPNGHLTGSSKDLELITNYVKNNFHKLKVNVAGQTDTGKSPSDIKTVDGRTKPGTFHPDVTPAIAGIEKAIGSLGDSEPNRFNVMLDDVYKSASRYAHDKSTKGDSANPHYDEYQKNIQKVLSSVSRYHGEGKAKIIANALKSLPQKQTPEAAPNQEEASNAQ